MKFIIYFLLFFCLFLPVCATSIDNEINEIFDLDEVIYIEEILPMNPQNDLINSKSPINVNFLYSTPYDLFGEGIIIFQYEDGVPDYTHLDLIGRVDWFGDDITDHATHIAGIMIGNGSLNSTIVGIAPKANIRADEVSGFNYNETGGIFGIEYDYDYAINFEDIDFASNSWGYPVKDLINSTNTEQLCSYYGDYESNAVLFDNIVYGNLTEIRVSKIPTIVFSVGNEREVWGINPCNTMNGNFNNMYPYYTISPPRVAKNIITVGAVESITNSIGYFSAFGPTDDGRIKPELVAPGLTNESLGIISTVSNNSYSYFLPDENNEDAYGTSMAAPHVSGTIALMLEQWNRQYSTDPLPSTIKALLLDSTTDLHRNGNGTKIIDGPDYKNGYGLLNAKEAVDRIINQTFIEDNISDDQIKVYAININNQNELKVTLAWDDLPGNPALSSEGVLVNDLNLKLISPNGITFYPWVLDPSQPQNEATKGEDHKNNVEQVYINNPINGEWLVLIDENNIDVSVNEQKFSLVSKNQIKPYNFQTEEKIITLNTENYWKNLNWKFDKTNYYATINSGSLLNNYLYYDEPLLKFQDTIFIKASSGSITDHHFLFGLEFNQTQNIDTWKNNYGHYMRYAIQFDPNTDKIRVSEFNNPQTGTTQFTAFPEVIFIPNQKYDFKIIVHPIKGAKYYYKKSNDENIISDINWSLLYDSTSSGNNNGVSRGTDLLKFWASGRNIDSSNQIHLIQFNSSIKRPELILNLDSNYNKSDVKINIQTTKLTNISYAIDFDTYTILCTNCNSSLLNLDNQLDLGSHTIQINYNGRNNYFDSFNIIGVTNQIEDNLNFINQWNTLNWNINTTQGYATINSGSLLNNFLTYKIPISKLKDTIFIKASSGSITDHHFLFGLEFNQTQNIDTWKNNYGHYMRYAIQFDPNTDKIRVSEFNNPQTGTTQFTAFPDVIFIPNQEYDFKIEVDSVKGAKYYYKISINPILIDDINWSLLYDSTSSGNNNGVLRGTDSLKFWACGRNIDSSNQINYIKFEANS